MDDMRDQTFAAWVQAERAAYEAVHQLHQSTQGGRLPPSPEAVAAVVKLRRTANIHLAQVSNSHPTPLKPAATMARQKRSEPIVMPLQRSAPRQQFAL